MAVANTAFWTADKWDESERMISESKPYCTHAPAKGRISLLSVSAVKTFVVTLQAAQAIWDLSSIFKHGDYSAKITLATIFSPFAVYGILRLMAAMWLSDKFGYVDVSRLDQWEAAPHLISLSALRTE
jgi:hypothetical protein